MISSNPEETKSKGCRERSRARGSLGVCILRLVFGFGRNGSLEVHDDERTKTSGFSALTYFACLKSGRRRSKFRVRNGAVSGSCCFASRASDSASHKSPR